MEQGFKKITFKDDKNKNKGEEKKGNTIGKLFLLSFFLLAIVIVLSIPFLVIPSYNLYTSVQKAVLSSQEVYTSFKNQDIETSRSKLINLEKDLNNIDSDFTKISWTKVIPFLGVYVKDAKHVLEAGKAAVSAGQITTETIIPYADLLGFKGKSTFVSGSADERIKLAVETLDKVVPSIDEIAQKIEQMEQELHAIDPDKYPEKIGSTRIKSNLITVKQIFSDTASLFVKARPLLKKVPHLLGTKEAKTYLVLFQNDAELRATGGFITAYAIFNINKGKMQVIRADDIYKLDEVKRKTYPAPSSIVKYHKNVTNLNLRDINLSPDYVASMKDFEKMLFESIPDFPKFDGIVALDTHVLVESIRILGEFNIYGRKFSSDNDKRCDCPKAIYELEDYATRPVAYVREDRKDIIGVLLYQVMQRALGVSPSQYWGKLFQMFLEEAKQKHILFYFHDEEAQKGIESLNFAGRIASTIPMDYLHVNDVNFAGAKSNMFIKESVKGEINVGSDGTVEKVITISYKNPQAASNCNLEAGELCLNGILRNWLRVYVPEGSTLVEFKGSEKQTVTYNELGKTVFEGFLTVKPQGAAEISIKYKLPFKVKKGEYYKLMIQKQPVLMIQNIQFYITENK